MPTSHFYWPRVALLGANIALPIATIANGMPWSLMWASFIAHNAFVYALMAPWCNWLGPAAMRFATEAREVWLTIDDGPDRENTVTLAQELERRGVRATFFIKGQNLAAQGEAARALLAAGHSLANHTATHPISTFWCLWPSRLRQEIDACNSTLRAAGVAVTRWFRSPLGLKHPWLHSILRQRGMRLVAWSARGHDGVICDPPAVERRIARLLSPGAIILLHEGKARSNEAILRVVDRVLAEGYCFTIPADEQLV